MLTVEIDQHCERRGQKSTGCHTFFVNILTANNPVSDGSIVYYDRKKYVWLDFWVDTPHTRWYDAIWSTLIKRFQGKLFWRKCDETGTNTKRWAYENYQHISGIRYRRGRPLGNDKFISKLEVTLNRRLRPLPGGRPKKKEKNDK